MEEGAGLRLGCLRGVGGKGSLDGDQGQEYQRDEEGPDGKLKCDACGKWVGSLLRHAFEEHIPCFVRPYSACWACHRQHFLPSSAMRHFKESGHEGSFSGEGQVGIVGRVDKKGNYEGRFEERMEGLGRNVGRAETVLGGTWGLDRGFGMEGRVVGGFL